jgi:uncharacterized membrane protein
MSGYSGKHQPYLIERLVSCLTYPTMGMIGFLWLILGLFTKSEFSYFSKFHIYQSIFLSIAYFLLSQIIAFLSNIASYIPLINKLVAQITFYFNMPLLFGYSVLQIVVYGTITYLAVFAFMGKFSYLPYVSEIISYSAKR